MHVIIRTALHCKAAGRRTVKDSDNKRFCNMQDGIYQIDIHNQVLTFKSEDMRHPMDLGKGVYRNECFEGFYQVPVLCSLYISKNETDH